MSFHFNPFTGNFDKTASSGDVVGPASSTDNGIARFDGTTGKLLKDSTTVALNEIADGTGDRLFGTDGSGNASEITLATGLTLASGVLSSKIVQVQIATYATAETNSTTSDANTSLAVTITPTSTSNTILLLAYVPFSVSSTGSITNIYAEYSIWRNNVSGTQVGTKTRSGVTLAAAATNYFYYGAVLHMLHETAPSTSAVTYTVAHASSSASATVTSFNGSRRGTLIALELLA